MTKAKVLALLIGVALLFVLPATVSAQRVPPHVFVGTATVDGASAPNGTTVTAWVDGAQVASTTVTGGRYSISVDQGDASFAGKKVSFKVGGNDATQSATWSFGGGDELNLTATAAPVVKRGAVLNLILYEDNKSGQNGTATLTEVDSQTEVVLSLSAGALKSELVHIHLGQCGPTLGKVDKALTSFVGGSGASTTTVAATLASLRDGNHAINTHEAGKVPNYTSCASIPKAGAPQLISGSALAALTGPAGPIGPAGRAGVKGDKGDTGPKGDKGDKGDRGVAGAVGPAGAKGDKGDAGAAGAAGARGAAGAAGAAGGAGAVGPAGASGDDASNVIGIIAIIIAAVAIVAWIAAFLMMRKKGAAT